MNSLKRKKKIQLQFQLQLRPISRISTPTPIPTPGVSTPNPIPTPANLQNINSGGFNSNSKSNSGVGVGVDPNSNSNSGVDPNPALHTTQETTPIFSRLIRGSWWNSYNGNPHQHPMQIRTKLGRLTCGSHDHSGLSINIKTPRDLNFLSARSTATATWKTARNGRKVKYLFSNSFTRKGWRKYRCELHA